MQTITKLLYSYSIHKYILKIILYTAQRKSGFGNTTSLTHTWGGSLLCYNQGSRLVAFAYFFVVYEKIAE